MGWSLTKLSLVRQTNTDRKIDKPTKEETDKYTNRWTERLQKLVSVTIDWNGLTNSSN